MEILQHLVIPRRTLVTSRSSAWRLVFDQEYPPIGVLRDQHRKKTWSNRSCRFYPQSHCALVYFCNFKHLESDAPPGWSFAELRNDGDVRGIPVTNRKACYHWRDGACRYGNSCKHVHFRHAWAPETMAPSTTNRPEQPQPLSGTSQSQWPGFAPSQSAGNTPSPAVTQPSSQDGATSTPAPDRDAWVTMVTRLLPLMVPQERSGTKREQIAGMTTQFAPRPFRFTTQFHLCAGMEFDTAMGHPGEGPSSADGSDSEMQKWFAANIGLSSRPPLGPQTLRLLKGLAGQERGCHGLPLTHRL